MVADHSIVSPGVDYLAPPTCYNLHVNDWMKMPTHGCDCVAVRLNGNVRAVQVGVPMISAISMDGPGVDAAAADRGRVLAGTGLARAAACGAAGPGWAPIEGLAAAGFQKYTTNQALKGVPAGKTGLYATHCFAPASDITLQIPVIPGSQLRVVLHFAETIFASPGKRVFDVFVNGNPQVCAGA